MKTKTPAAPTAPDRPSRRAKAAPPMQMSLMDLETDAVPVKSGAPVPPRPKKVPAVAAAPKVKAVPPPKPPAPKRVPVKADRKPPVAEPVRVVPESILGSGAVWKMSGKHGVAYVKDAALAGELLATDPRNLAKAAMAVYYDKKGKAFAWQVRFDTDRWEEVMKRLA